MLCWISDGVMGMRGHVKVSLSSPVNNQQLFTLECCPLCVKEKKCLCNACRIYFFITEQEMGTKKLIDYFLGGFRLRFWVKTSLIPPSAQQQYDVQDSLGSVRGIWQKFLPSFPPESKARESVFVRLRSGAGYQKSGVQGEGWHASSRCKHTRQYTHDGRVPQESWW